MRYVNICDRRFVWAIAAVFSFVFAAWFAFRPPAEKSIRYSGPCDRLSLTVAGTLIISDGPRETGDCSLNLLCEAVVFTGTQVTFNNPKTGKTIHSFEPSESDHIGYFDFGSSHRIAILLQQGATVDLINGDTILEHPAFDDILGKRPKHYDYAFIFRDAQDHPLWEMLFPISSCELDPVPNAVESHEAFIRDDVFSVTSDNAVVSDEDSHGTAAVFGYSDNFAPLLDIKEPNVALVSGHFFQKENWEISFPPLFIDPRGYLIKIPPAGKKLRIQVVPKLHIIVPSLAKQSLFQIICSRISLSEATGEVFLVGKKVKESGAMTNVDVRGQQLRVVIRPRDGIIHTEIEGHADSLKIDGDEQIVGRIAAIVTRHPVLVSIATALISSFLGALIATKGKVISKWVRSEES